jgi:hypothetical protein
MYFFPSLPAYPGGLLPRAGCAHHAQELVQVHPAEHLVHEPLVFMLFEERRELFIDCN